MSFCGVHNMPDQKHQGIKQATKNEQLKSEHEIKARQKNDADKLAQQIDELKQQKEKKRKLELVQEMEKKRERDKKEEDERDRIKREQAAESNTIYCTICHFPILRCRCISVGGGGGGGEETDEKLDSESKTSATLVGKLSEMASQFGAAVMEAIGGGSSKKKSHQIAGVMFNTDVISDLLSMKSLLIQNNRDSGILTIKLLCVPVEKRKDVDKFIEAILKQLDEFKKDKGIVADCIKRDNDGSLYITLSPPKMYDEFIQLLARKKLLPKQVIEQQENKYAEFQKDMNHFNPTPLSTKLTYESRKNTNLTDEELSKIEKLKASSIRPRSPSDGPKPTK